MKLAIAALHESPSGTSRHFTVLQNLFAIGGIGDVEQAAPIKRGPQSGRVISNMASGLISK
jgi:hypothetical protein